LVLKIHAALHDSQAAALDNTNFKIFARNSFAKVIKILSDATLLTQNLSPKAQILSSAAHSKLSTPDTLSSLPNAPPCSRSTFQKDKRALPANLQSREYFVSPLARSLIIIIIIIIIIIGVVPLTASHSFFLLSFRLSRVDVTNYTIKGCTNDICLKCGSGVANTSQIIQK
jgi:hypothetical protein